MGNSHSSSSSPRYASATRAFSEKELEDLKSLFASLATQSQSENQYIPPSIFKKYIGIHGPLGDRMFDLITQKRKDMKLSFKDLVVAKGTYEKGTTDEIEEYIYQLSDVNGDGTLGRSDIEAVLTDMFDYIFSDQQPEPGAGSHLEIIQIFLGAAKFSEDDGGCAMSFDNFKRWCTLLPSVRKFIGTLLVPSNPEDGNTGYICGPSFSFHCSLLHTTPFVVSLRNDEGPTVLIIKDREGYLYGGYASQPWGRHADFYGDMKSFLFQLYPHASVFRPTGANRNLQWCGVNFSSESIPNGIGFGGKVNHFGFFLSANFDQGQTFSCTTFGSPCLSKTSQICPEVIECWGVVQKGSSSQQEKQDGVKGTVLERFKEDRHMLNMVGLANSSE